MLRSKDTEVQLGAGESTISTTHCHEHCSSPATPKHVSASTSEPQLAASSCLSESRRRAHPRPPGLEDQPGPKSEPDQSSATCTRCTQCGALSCLCPLHIGNHDQKGPRQMTTGRVRPQRPCSALPTSESSPRYPQDGCAERSEGSEDCCSANLIPARRPGGRLE
eukprot:157314-Rhodomonas_salina.1